MTSFALIRQLSDSTRKNNSFYCYCYDYNDGDNDINNTSKFIRLGCNCILHYHCLIQYIRSKLGDRLSMSLNGISCPYGSECKSFNTLDEVGGDDTKVYHITVNDLDNVVDYGSNHLELQKYLDENDCKPLTYEEVNGLKQWIEERRNEVIKKFSDEDYDLFIISTTKACPTCGYRSTHYHGHQCHHISPSRPPNRGGCPNCHVNYCYKCLSTENENRRERGSDGKCRCGYWINFCQLIKSSDGIKSYIAINAGGIPYDSRCGCVICSDCRYNNPCYYCLGDCCVCQGYINPSPNEIIDINNKEKIWKAEGPAFIKRNNNGTSIWECCRHGYSDQLMIILQQPNTTIEDLNRSDRDQRTGLYLACDAGHFECVQLLLSHADIDINKAANNCWTPLYSACLNGYTECVQLLLSHADIDINKATNDGRTPLNMACGSGHTECVQLLLSHADIDNL